MSKYDADKIVRNLSCVNKIMEPMNKAVEPMVRLNKNCVNYDELLGISKLCRDELQPDRESIDLACEPITPIRGRIVNKTYNIESKNVQIGDGNTQSLVEPVASGGEEITIARNTLKVTIIGVAVAIVGVIVTVCLT